MRLAPRSCILLLAAAIAGNAADPDGDDLLRRVRARVLDDVSRVPRYTCVQTVDRSRYIPVQARKPESCSYVSAARKQLLSPGYPVWRDRLRLDVAVVKGSEIFSWAGAGRFETGHIDDLVPTGAAGTGEFVSFLHSTFGGEPDSISFSGLSLFNFTVPLAKSHYMFHGRGGSARAIAYYGSFRVDPEAAEIKRLTIRADQFPADAGVCTLEDSMNYERVKIGNGDFLLPSVAVLDVLNQDGSEFVNETRYSECREYVGESTIHFDDPVPEEKNVAEAKSAPGSAAPGPLRRGLVPPGLRFRIALASPVHAETAAAGDALAGVVLDEVRDPAGALVAAPNDIVRGHILRLEQYTFPAFRWIFAIRFETLQHEGAERPVVLQSLDGGVFTFREAGNLTIDRGFQSMWETR